MRTALNLLNKIVDLGYDQQKTLICIDKILDEKLGIEGRKPLSDENLSDIIYDNILGIFQKEARSNQHDFKNNIKIEILAKRGKYMTEKQNTEFILTEEVINECLRLM